MQVAAGVCRGRYCAARKLETRMDTPMSVQIIHSKGL